MSPTHRNTTLFAQGMLSVAARRILSSGRAAYTSLVKATLPDSTLATSSCDVAHGAGTMVLSLALLCGTIAT